MVTIGFLESRSFARGMSAADAMLKAADVRLIRAGVSCPGKYTVLIAGEVSAVQAAIEAGEAAAEKFVTGKTVLARLDSQVVRALEHKTPPQPYNAVGVVECSNITGSVLGADAAVKAADVVLLELRLGNGIGGKSYLVVTGDVAAVSAAVEVASAKAQESGRLLEAVVIPRPDKSLFRGLTEEG